MRNIFIEKPKSPEPFYGACLIFVTLSGAVALEVTTFPVDGVSAWGIMKALGILGCAVSVCASIYRDRIKAA